MPLPNLLNVLARSLTIGEVGTVAREPIGAHFPYRIYVSIGPSHLPLPGLASHFVRSTPRIFPFNIVQRDDTAGDYSTVRMIPFLTIDMRNSATHDESLATAGCGHQTRTNCRRNLDFHFMGSYGDDHGV